MFAAPVFRIAMNSVPLIAGAIVAALGFVVLLGWQVAGGAVTHVRAWLPPMLPLTALGFVLTGCGLIALHRGYRAASNTAAALVLAIALGGFIALLPTSRPAPRPAPSVTPTETTTPGATAADATALDVDSRTLIPGDPGPAPLPENGDPAAPPEEVPESAVEQLARTPETDQPNPLGSRTPPTAPIAPNTAMAFALAGLGLLVTRRYVYAGALLGVGVLTLGSVAMLGYAVDVARAFAWSGTISMAIHSALGFMILGAGLVVYALGIENSVRDKRSWWRAMLVGTSAAVAGLLFWGALRAEEQDNVERMVAASGYGVRGELSITTSSIVLALGRLVEHGMESRWDSPEEWRRDARLTVGAFRGFHSIEWTDAEFEPRVVAMRDAAGSRKLAPTNQNAFRRERALELVRETGQVAIVGPFDFEGGGQAFRVVLPLKSIQNAEAYLSGVFSVEEALSGITEQLSYEYDIVFLCQGREVFRVGTLNLEDPGPWMQRFTVDLPGTVDWEIAMAPTAASLAALTTPLPDVALGAALLIALLLTLTIRFADMAMLRAAALSAAVHDRTRELEKSMTNLQNEVFERRRTESALRRTQTLGRLVSAELDLSKVVQAVTDAATELTGAQCGCLIYTAEDDDGERHTRHTVSGDREIFAHLDDPDPGRRVSPMFAHPRPVRLHDIRQDPRHGGSLPQHTPPGSAVEIASYLAVPVVSRSGQEWGALQFGHASPGVFVERDEDTAVSLAAQAAIAMDNAMLYEREQRASKQERATNEAKDNFIHLLGHELRNPLGSIRTALQVLMAASRQRKRPAPVEASTATGQALEPTSAPDPTVPDQDDEARMRRIIDRQVDQLTRLVDDLLQVSQLSSDKLTFRPTSVDLRELVLEAVESVRTRFERAGITVTSDTPRGSVQVHADPHRIRQVLANLLTNARKFSDAGDSVHVELWRDGPEDEAVVSVRDTGCGIDSKDLMRVFEPFVQTELAKDRMTGGLGLGLPIVKGLIEAQGGVVEVHSEGRDLGAEFLFRLPLQRVIVAPIPERPAPEGATPRRILVVDDHRDSADALKRLLDLSGNEVEVAYDGPEGIELAHQFRPEVLICDLGLPGMDGFEVARRLADDPQTESIHLIALTGFGDEDTIRAAREAGFRHHLTKPVETTRLERLLAEVD